MTTVYNLFSDIRTYEPYIIFLNKISEIIKKECRNI